MRTACAFALLLAGAVVVLVGGPDYGVNGASVLGVLLCGAGIAVHLTGPAR